MAHKQHRQVKRKTDKPAVSNALLLSVVALAFVLLALWQVQLWITSPATLPLKLVRIEGDLKYLKLAELENAVAGKVSGGFFSIDLQAVKAAAGQLPWLQQVSVKRVWPNALVISVEERVPVARWGDTQLVTANGEVFISQGQGPANLPQLDGPLELAPLLVERLQHEAVRFADLDLSLSAISVNPRGSWQLQFSNGLQVALGQTEVAVKLERLARHIVKLRQMHGMPLSIDLRYRHGMAVKWQKQAEQQADTAGDGQHRGNV